MKTIGLLGGMSWESTLEYYRLINKGIKSALGGLYSAKIILHSLNFEPIEKLQQAGDWKAIAEIITREALGIQAAGADFMLICTNTIHKVVPEMEQVLDIPVLHIADATAGLLVDKGIKTIGLLGTSFTMEHDFYKERLKKRFGLKVIIPESSDRKIVHNVIFHELCKGIILKDSKTEYQRIINALALEGAEAVILGCTEIGTLVSQDDTNVKLYDTTLIHAAAAVKTALDQV